MLKQFQKLKNDPKKRAIVFICAICIIVAAVVIFIGFELDRNQTLYYKNYIKKQQQLTDQVAIRMQSYIEAEGLSIDITIDKIISEVKTTGDSYWFIAKNEDMLFVKDKISSDLFEFIPLPSYIHDTEEDDMHITYKSFNIKNDKYTIGNCIATSYINGEGQLFKHNIYVIMPLILIGSIIIVVTLSGMLLINKQESRIRVLSTEAIERNVIIEQLNTRIKKIRLNDLGGVKRKSRENIENPIYNKEILGSLLAKINRENIVPLMIVIIELSSKNKIFQPEDYQQFMKSASGFLGKEHVLAEIIPGIFTILLFHTGSDSKEEIKHNLISEWALPLKKKGVKVRMGISCIEDYDINVENVFEIVYREVSGIYDENQMQLSS